MVNDEEDRTAVVGQQSATELDEGLRVNPAGVEHKMQAALGADRGEHVDRVPLSGGGHHRGLPDQRPGGVRMAARPDTGLVTEVDRRAGRHSLSLDGRVADGLPLPDRLRVLLVGAHHRLLR